MFNSTTMDDLAADLGDGHDTFRSWNSQPSRSRWVHAGYGNDNLLLGGESGHFAAWHYAFVGEGFDSRRSW